MKQGNYILLQNINLVRFLFLRLRIQYSNGVLRNRDSTAFRTPSTIRWRKTGRRKSCDYTQSSFPPGNHIQGISEIVNIDFKTGSKNALCFCRIVFPYRGVYNTGTMCGYNINHSKTFCLGMTGIRQITR